MIYIHLCKRCTQSPDMTEGVTLVPVLDKETKHPRTRVRACDLCMQKKQNCILYKMVTGKASK